MRNVTKENKHVAAGAAISAAPSQAHRAAAGQGTEADLAAADTAVVELLSPLPDQERARLEECEEILRPGFGTFFAVGSALLTIRDERLYRASHPTFEAYCHERWQIGRSYAWRVIAAAERIKLLPAGENLPKPTSEFLVRPFLKLNPELFPKAWGEAVERAAGSRITLPVVRSVVREFSRKRRSWPKRKESTRLRANISAGQIIALLQEARKRVQKHDVDEVLNILDQIEDLLVRDRKT